MSKWIAEFELEDGDKMPGHMDLEYHGVKLDFHCRPLEQEPCEDAVSRKEVINQIFYSTDNNGDVVLGSALRERIARLPSVTPQEPKWIPVTERLPEVETDVLICYSNTISVGYWYVDTATYDFEFRDLCETGWYYSQDDEFKSCDPYDVIAWMPLPQPYKAKSVKVL